MNTASLVALGGFLLGSSLATASPYQTDITASYIDFDGSDDYSLRAARYFAPVTSSGYPLAEAAFLGRASSLYLDYDRLDDVYGSRDRVNIGLGYYIPDSILYVGANVVHISELDDGFESDASDTDWGLTLGVAPIDGLLVATSYRMAPLMYAPHSTQLMHYFAGTEEEGNRYDLNLSAKYVAQLDGDTAIKLTGTYADQRWGNMVSLGADYFVDPTFSVGAWFEDLGSPFMSNGYGIRTEKFFKQQFSAQAWYVDYDDFSVWSIGAGMRF